MKFAFHLFSPTELVRPESIPGGEKNVNGDTYQKHFSEAGIVPLALDLREAGFMLKTYSTFHVLYNKENRRGISATKLNRISKRSFELRAIVTDKPFVVNPSIDDMMISTLFEAMWELMLPGYYRIYMAASAVKRGEFHPVMSFPTDYTEMVTELRSWPQRVALDKDKIVAARAFTKKQDAWFKVAVSPNKFQKAMQDCMENEVKPKLRDAVTLIKVEGVSDAQKDSVRGREGLPVDGILPHAD